MASAHVLCAKGSSSLQWRWPATPAFSSLPAIWFRPSRGPLPAYFGLLLVRAAVVLGLTFWATWEFRAHLAWCLPKGSDWVLMLKRNGGSKCDVFEIGNGRGHFCAGADARPGGEGSRSHKNRNTYGAFLVQQRG